jgi:hypothetical protein
MADDARLSGSGSAGASDSARCTLNLDFHFYDDKRINFGFGALVG